MPARLAVGGAVGRLTFFSPKCHHAQRAVRARLVRSRAFANAHPRPCITASFAARVSLAVALARARLAPSDADAGAYAPGKCSRANERDQWMRIMRARWEHESMRVFGERHTWGIGARGGVRARPADVRGLTRGREGEHEHRHGARESAVS